MHITHSIHNRNIYVFACVDTHIHTQIYIQHIRTHFTDSTHTYNTHMYIHTPTHNTHMYIHTPTHNTHTKRHILYFTHTDTHYVLYTYTSSQHTYKNTDTTSMPALK